QSRTYDSVRRDRSLVRLLRTRSIGSNACGASVTEAKPDKNLRYHSEKSKRERCIAHLHRPWRASCAKARYHALPPSFRRNSLRSGTTGRSPQRPAQIGYRRRSPPGKTYSPILFLTGRRDHLAHPGHARKMAAKLQVMGTKPTSTNPPPAATVGAR